MSYWPHQVSEVMSPWPGYRPRGHVIALKAMLPSQLVTSPSQLTTSSSHWTVHRPFGHVTVPVPEVMSPSLRPCHCHRGNVTVQVDHTTITFGQVTILFRHYRPSLSRYRLSWTCHCHSGHVTVPVCHVIDSVGRRHNVVLF